MPRSEGVLRNKGAQARVPVPLKGKIQMGGLGAGHKSDPPALKLRRGMGGTGGEDGRAGSGAQIGPACAKATARHGRNGRRRWEGWERGTNRRGRGWRDSSI